MADKTFMDLENMRQNRVHALLVICLNCGHDAEVNVDAYPPHLAVKSFENKWPCSKCGVRRSDVRPAWRTQTPYEPI